MICFVENVKKKNDWPTNKIKYTKNGAIHVQGLIYRLTIYWVNISKRGGKDVIFRRLAGLIRGISQEQSPREILRISPTSPRKTPSFLTLLLRFTFFFKYVSILALLKCTVGSVLVLLKSIDVPYLPSSGCPKSSPTRFPQSVNSDVEDSLVYIKSGVHQKWKSCVHQ